MTYYVSSGTLNPTHSLTHSNLDNSIFCGSLLLFLLLLLLALR